ncbi:Myoferlin [Exaiptasia diaphana]|nr:Myoferlin [Exaiptasia diaphana]
MEEAPADTTPSETPPPSTPAAAPPPPAEIQPPPPPPPASEPIKEASDKKESVQEKEGEECDQPDSTRSCNSTLMTNDQLPKCHSPGHDDRPAFQTTREPSIERSKLPTNKAIDFQVRVRVVEGRNISGSNISPVVKVTVSNQVRQTRVKKSTNKPFFDEIFFFNFKIIASELFDQTITFEIFNSRKLRSNAMIGTFSSDVGFFYDQKDHSVIRRWLLLTDPEDIMAGPKGYLKVTVMVLGPGDEAPEVSESAGQDDEDDLEE